MNSLFRLGSALRKAIPLFIIGATALSLQAIPPRRGMQGADRQSYKIYVDKEGVMRRDDTGAEVSYYGTNYTAPFAYSYRALGALGKDRQEAIAKDVYHIARLGLNAFRLHLWDVELSDSVGNLLENDHLDLLDFMIAELEKRGIDILLTAQTNFGNGYPEKDIDTGGFSYRFPKCGIHEDPRAQEIQARYLSQLASHVNPYTGRSYADDNAIIGMEINNEPCHKGTVKETTAYIDRMAGALRKAGFDKPIFYNVSHNPEVTEAYYKANIDGTTFQWYPTGLVAGHERKGNFLPALDNYTIPWKGSMKGYDRLAKAVYEFDPADVLYSHLYPAIARTFRKEGFQWITQFAYDPLYLAPYNTEYPTHYLNLVYTPAKALSMMIAAEAARELPRGADFGNYPANTTFGHTSVSYDPDLSIFNDGRMFIYTNSTDAKPIVPDSLTLIAGHGDSPVARYEGNGAYFLDKIPGADVWRLEVMPDIFMLGDPFAATDTLDTKTLALPVEHTLTLDIPSLGKDYKMRLMMAAADGKGWATGDDVVDRQATGGSVRVTPGTYLLVPQGEEFPDRRALQRGQVNGLGLAEYAAPDFNRYPVTLLAPAPLDPAIDINMIPEEWSFRLDYRDLGYAEPKFYSFSTNPSADGVTVIRRYVGDKIEKLPADLTFNGIKVAFADSTGMAAAPSLPEEAKIAVVTKEGATFAAPLVTDENGKAYIELSKFSPSTGVIVPAPYPTMLTREIPEPTASSSPLSLYDVEYVELILPHRAGLPLNFNLSRIWAE